MWRRRCRARRRWFHQVAPRRCARMKITKIIHQTYADRSKVHSDFERNIAKLKKMNPGWEYRFYDDGQIRDFIRSNYDRNTRSYFDRINPRYGPARADFFRYLLMYACGGVYLDLKSTLMKPLDLVLRESDSYLLSRWNDKMMGVYPDLGIPQGEFQQWHIVCAPEHPYLKAVIGAVMRNLDTYDQGNHGVGKMGVLKTTGPIAYTRALMPILQDHAHREVDIRKECGFEYNIFKNIFNLRSYLKYSNGHYSREMEPIVLNRQREVTGFLHPAEREIAAVPVPV
jgi:inositol phosphorylceramide mannosyltransferase catalytic subunit